MSKETEFDPQALLERLQALEAENKKLKDADSKIPPSLVVVETEYKGHPMLEFRPGNARPFRLGVKKLEAIQEAWHKVDAFLKENGETDDQI